MCKSIAFSYCEASADPSPIVAVSLSVSIPLIMFAMNMEWCSNLYRDFRYDYLVRMCIKLISYLPHLPRLKGPATTSLINKWTMHLRYMREDYLSTETKKVVIDDLRHYDRTITEYRIKEPAERASGQPVGGGAKNLARAMRGSSSRLRLPRQAPLSSEHTDTSTSTGCKKYFDVGGDDLWEQDAGQIV